MMHGHEKSDPAIVAVKPAKKAEQSAAELVEPRAGTKGNAGQQSTRRTQSRISVSQALERIRKVGVTHPRWEPYAGKPHVRICAGGGEQSPSLPRPLRRRDLIKLFGVAATFRPITAKAQPSAVPIIGFLHAGSLAGSPSQVAGYRQGLKEAGFVEGQNLAIEYRWAEGHYERLPTLAADLVERKVAVLIAGGGDSPTKAAKAATKAIPIVFVTGTDPVKSGLVASLSRPGGSITGVSIILSTLMAKNLDLLHRLVPSAGVIGALVNPQYSDADVQFQEIQEAAHTVGLKIYLARASTESEVQSAFAAMVQQGVGALLVANDLFFTTHRKQIIDFAARNALPAIYYSGDFTTDGGLMSYSTSLRDAYQQAGHYTANILKGAKPSDLPVVQPTKFELVINLKTAKALGLDIPPTLLALADEVIE